LPLMSLTGLHMIFIMTESNSGRNNGLG